MDGMAALTLSAEYPLSGMIVWLVNFITEFQNKYFLRKDDERFYVDEVKKYLLMLQSGLDIAYRVILKENRESSREWYYNVKETVYQIEDLFEDIELEIMAESHKSPEVSKVMAEELVEDNNVEGRLPYLSPNIISSSSSTTTTKLWSLLLQRQRRADLFLALNSGKPVPVPSTEFRMTLIIRRMDNLVTALSSLEIFRNPPSMSLRISSQIISHKRMGRNDLGVLVDDEKHRKDPGYENLPWHFRQCLEFCYIFPTDFSFSKEDLVLLWVAQGFVHPVPGCSLEDEAAYYFDTLLFWSYFQKSNDQDPPSYKLRLNWITIDPFVMPHEYIQYHPFHSDVSDNIRHARHASVSCSSISQGHLAHCARGLRTILMRNNWAHISSNSPLNKIHGFLFLEVRNDGSQIAELRDLNDLCGQLSIKKLENVASLEEAEEARLHLKQGIHKLCLWWSANYLKVNYDIIQGLRPHHNLKALEIFNYSMSKFPSWVSDPLFTNLISITLTLCITQELPPFGRLPRLESLKIAEAHKVKHIGHEFYGHGMVKIGFPSLLTLNIFHMKDLETWVGFNHSDFPMLQELYVSDCENLKHLPEMKSLNSLVKIDILHCPKLQCLPKKGFPIMVKHLRVSDCPKLEERCQRGSGLDWEKIAHISVVQTDLSEMYPL
ncbi:putative disease resistance RPP13-like protein 1 [Fagus crenata]